jgi:hypothetical protein
MDNGADFVVNYAWGGVDSHGVAALMKKLTWRKNHAMAHDVF